MAPQHLVSLALCSARYPRCQVSLANIEEGSVAMKTTDEQPRGARSEEKAAWINGTAVVVAAVIGAAATLIAAILVAKSGNVPEALLPKPTSTVTVTATRTITASPSASNGSNPTSSSIRPGRVTYLDSLPPVEGGLDRESVTWGDRTFSRSLTNPLSGCSDKGPVDWVIPADAGTFVAEIGVETDAVEAESRVTFNVFVDGTLGGESPTLGVGEHQPIEIPVRDKSRIRLESIIDQSRRSNCNTEAVAVWGDAAFVP